MSFDRIHLTGSAGFIGTSLAKALSRYFRHTTLKYDFTTGYKTLHPKVLLDQVASGRCKKDLILHFGAVADTRISSKNLIQERNFDYCEELARALQRGGGKLIFASSAAVYGNALESGRDSDAVLSKYALSKKFAELVFLDAFKERFCDLTILRLFNVYGPNEISKGNMMSIPSRFIVDAITDGQIGIWTSNEFPSQSRDFVHVSDVVNFILKLLNKMDQETIIDVGSGTSVAFLDLAEHISSIVTSLVVQQEFPIEILKNTYQFYTLANTSRMRRIMPDLEPKRVLNEVPRLITHYRNLLKESKKF